MADRVMDTLRRGRLGTQRHTRALLMRKETVNVCPRMLPLAHHLLPRPSSLGRITQRPLFTLPDLSKFSPFSQPNGSDSAQQTYNERKILPYASRFSVC